MQPQETSPIYEEFISPTEGEAYEDISTSFSDGMEPITFPEMLTKENYQGVFGATLPEGLSPDIFEQGGSLSLSE